MVNHLYDIFKHWTYVDGLHKNSVYLIGDPHFNDPDSKFFRGDNYPGDEEQVKLINSKVGKNDTIIFLGDIWDTEFVKQIRGYKVLILGNHDKGATTYKEVFNEVYEGPLMISDKIILSHEPVNFDFAFNIHGHVHGEHQNDNMHFNVCAEHIDYTPVSLNSLVKEGMFKDVPNIHRNTIDRAIIRKEKKIHG